MTNESIQLQTLEMRPKGAGLFFHTGLVSDDLQLALLTTPDMLDTGPRPEWLLVADVRWSRPRRRYDLTVYDNHALPGPKHEGLGLQDLIGVAARFGVNWLVPTAYGANDVDAALAARALGIPNASPEAAYICSRKSLADVHAERAGFMQPPSFVCSNAPEIRAAVRDLGGRAFIKPLEDGTGSLSACRVDISQPDDFERRLQWHLDGQARWKFDETQVQGFVHGEEYGALFTVRNGHIGFFMTCRKEMTTGAYRKEVGHIFDPADRKRISVAPRMREALQRFVTDLHQNDPTGAGLENCFIHCEIIAGPDGNLFLPDISLRLGGPLDFLADAALGAPTGYFFALANSFSAGDDVDFSPVGKPYAAIARNTHQNGGRVHITSEQDRLKRMRANANATVLWSAKVRDGQEIPALRTWEDKGGHSFVLVTAPTRQLAQRAFEESISSLGYEVEAYPGRSEPVEARALQRDGPAL